MRSIAQKELQTFPPIRYLICFMQGWLKFCYQIPLATQNHEVSALESFKEMFY